MIKWWLEALTIEFQTVYTITKNITLSEIPEATGVSAEGVSTGYLQGFNSTTLKFSIISFSSNTKLITGDRVVYFASNQTIPGLISGSSYYVEVLSSGNKIKLYQSPSFIGTDYYIEFDSLSAGTGTHRFVLYRHKSLYLSPQKLLKKFPLSQSYQSGDGDKTLPGGIGMLINGVEIISPKTDDRIYYGPLSQFKVVNGGRNYDVINPIKPKIVITLKIIWLFILFILVSRWFFKQFIHFFLQNYFLQFS